MPDQPTSDAEPANLLQTLKEALLSRPPLTLEQQLALSEKARRELQETLSATTPMDRFVEEHNGYTVITFKRRPPAP